MAIAACSRMRLRRVFERRRNRRVAVGRLEAAYADDAARGDQRTELEAHVGQRAGLPARRLALVEGPARGAVLARIEFVDRRPGGAQRQLAVLGQQHDDAARSERLVGVDGRRIEDVVERRRAGKLARELEQRAGRLGAGARQPLLVARPAGEPADQARHGEEDDEGEEFLRLGDGELVVGRDEEEVVGEKRQHRRHDRRAHAEARRRQQHRDEEDHRQVGQAQPAVERLADADGDGDRSRRGERADRQVAAEREGEAAPARRFARLVAGDDMHADEARAARQRVGKRAAGEAAEEARLRAADDDLGDVLALGVTEDLGRQVMADQPGRFRAQALRQPQRRVDRAAAAGVAARPIDRRRHPARVEAGGEPARRPHHVHRQRVGADADQQALARLPRAADRALAQLFDHLVVDPRRRAAQRDLAQRGQVAQGEELLLRQPRRVRQIDLAVLQALDQVFRRDVDEHDVVGVAQHDVGNGLAHDDAGDARNDVGEALEVLDVERGPDVDARVEQLLDVLPALGMAALRRVGVGEFVDDDQLGPAARARRRGRTPRSRGPASAPSCAAGFRGLGSALPFRRANGFRLGRRRCRRLPHAAAGRAAAWRRSCRRRARRRGTPATCRACPSR